LLFKGASRYIAPYMDHDEVPFSPDSENSILAALDRDDEEDAQELEGLLDLLQMMQDIHGEAAAVLADAENEEPGPRYAVPHVWWRRHTFREEPAYVFWERQSEEMFRQRFRVTRAMYERICGDISPSLSASRLPIQQQVLCALERLARPTTLEQLAVDHDMAKGSVVNVSRRVWRALYETYWHVKVTSLAPTSEESRRNMALDFERISGLPDCIGIIDCSHHCIKAPAGTKAESDVFFNHKDGHSIRFQAVVDPYRRIYDIRYGIPGSVNDSTVLLASQLWQQREDFIPPPYFIAADGGYSLTRRFITPFFDRENADDIKTTFNWRFSQTRVRVEQSFGILKGRFRALMHVFDLDTLQDYRLAVFSAVILHNWLITDKVDLQNEDIDAARAVMEADRDDAVLHAAAGGGNAAAAAPDLLPDNHAGGTRRRAQLMRAMGIISTAAEEDAYTVD
jgi:hypothetical protein